MHRSIDNSYPAVRAFTLLEMILSVALTGILALAAFTLTNGAVQMGAELGQDQKRALEVQRCIEVFRMQMESLPGSTKFELLVEDNGIGSLSELRLYDVPEAFQVGGTLHRSDAVSIISEEFEAGGLSLSLRYDTFGETEDSLESRYLPLMAGLSEVRWRFYSNVNEDWLSEWEDGQGRPRFIELNIAFVEGRKPIRTVFWLPPVANPRAEIDSLGRDPAPQEGQAAPQTEQGVPNQPPGSPVLLQQNPASPR